MTDGATAKEAKVDDAKVDDAPPGSAQIAALLRGEAVPKSSEPFNRCVQSLHSLEFRIEKVKETSRRTLSPFIQHVDNLVRNGVEPILREEITVVQPDGQVSTFYFGQVFRPYDLDFLRDTVTKVVEDLGSRPDAADASLRVLTPYLQTWVDFIIPSALGDLDAASEKATATVAFSPKLRQMYRDQESIRRLSSLERQAEAAVRNLKTAAGEGGKERLAQTFDDRGKAEAKSASNWNILVILFVALGIGLPLVAISLEDHFLGQLSEPYGVAIKALIGLPLFALATYSGRISAQHRHLSHHMRVLTAQIDSVKAYVAALPEPVQQEIIIALGKRAFSEPGITSAQAGTVGIPPEQILPSLEKAIDAIKEIRK
jgi:hypothetical protein